VEEMDPVVRQEIDGEVKPEPSHWYEGHISLEDAKTFIKSNITTAARSFIAIGFYLKCVRDRGLFAEDNYQDVWDFAKSEYGISKSTASRYMSMNDRFSENGNSPNICEEYRAFGKSQLQEMLYLEDEQLEQVKPGDRVEDIRNLRRPKEIPYIELPGQMDFEIDFPDILPPDQIEQPVTLQKQTFEINVEDLLSGNEKGGVAISQQAEKEISSSKSGCITGLSPYGSCVCCGANGVECCSQCGESCNGRCGWLEDQPKEEVLERENNHNFTATPFGCPYREGYSCTVPIENRSYPGNGYNCGSSCCWSCKFHGACKLECNASAGRNGSLPEYDAAWFVNEWGKRVPEELKGVLKECKEQENNSDRAKAVQKYLAPYGYHGTGCGDYDFTYHGFAGGIDLKIGKVDTHLKYGRFVQELMNLFPDFEEPVSEEPESVPEQEESVPEYTENVIDGEYEEVTPEPTSPFVYSLEDIREETNFLKEQLKLLGDEDSNLKFARKLRMQYDAILLVKKEFENYLNRQDDEPEEPEYPEQPELPLLKNNDQRAAFIDAYETWPIWIETKETGERYYRYDLSEKAAIVVKVYWKHSWESYKESKDYEYGAQQYYLMGVKSEWCKGKNVYVQDDTRSFYECSTNRSALVEYLKDFQKSK